MIIIKRISLNHYNESTDSRDKLKAQGFVIYPGKVSKASAFRIGNVGDVYPADMERLVKAIEGSMFWKD